MQGKIVAQCLVYSKKKIVGDRTSQFVPTGTILGEGENISADRIEEDHTGKFLHLTDGPHQGKYVDQSYTNIILATT